MAKAVITVAWVSNPPKEEQISKKAGSQSENPLFCYRNYNFSAEKPYKNQKFPVVAAKKGKLLISMRETKVNAKNAQDCNH